MSDSYTNLIYHLVFSTKDRRPLITAAHETRLYEYIGGIVRELGGISLELNGTEDHVHLLAKLRPDKSVSDVLRDLKSNATPAPRACSRRISFPALLQLESRCFTKPRRQERSLC